MENTIIEIPFGKVIVYMPYLENTMNLKTKKGTVFKENIDLSLVNGIVEITLPEEEFGKLSFILEVNNSQVTEARIIRNKFSDGPIVLGNDRTLIYSIYTILNIISEF